MIYRILADLTVVVHFAFVLFVVLGGLLALRWPQLMWFHIPAVVWGALIEFADWPCPLTPLENRFRRLSGEAGYEGGFVERYILSIVYPEGLTREIQLALGLLVIVVNALIYWRIYARRRKA